MLKHISASNMLHLTIYLNGYLTLGPTWAGVDQYIGHSQLYYIESGHGWLRTKKETVILEPGYAYLLPARLHMDHGCTTLKKLFIQFRLTAVDTTDLLGEYDRICRVPYKPEELQTLVACREANDCISMLRLQSIMYDTICRIVDANNLPPIRVKPHSELLGRAVQLILTAPSIKLSGKSLADRLFVSESRLRNAFKEELNTTLGQYIDFCVYNAARTMLADAEYSVEQISQQLGFCDQFYFSKRFKKRFGVTPSGYRKQLLTEQA